eukprot:COSAG02_NODE_1273_length_13520_cov_2.622010_2_plen_66_part_00
MEEAAKAGAATVVLTQHESNVLKFHMCAASLRVGQHGYLLGLVPTGESRLGLCLAARRPSATGRP